MKPILKQLKNKLIIEKQNNNKNIINAENDNFDNNIIKIINIFNNYVITNNNISFLDNIKNNYNIQHNKKYAIIVHIFYIDIWWNYIFPKLKEFDFEYDLYIAITDNNSINDINKIKETYKNAKIYIVKNIGEDIRSFIQIVNDILDKNIVYDYILKLHTKHSSIKQLVSLLNTLLSKEAISSLKENNGLISNKYYVGYYKNGMCDTEYFNEISNMIGNKTQLFKCAFGNMFWIHYSILKKYLTSNKLPYTYFDQEYAPNKSKMHSMERIFGAITIDAGMNVLGITFP